MTVQPFDCRCLECTLLMRQMGGWGAARLLANRLSRRGWAGSYNPDERAWLRKHPPKWWEQRRSAAVEASGRRLRALVYGKTT